MFRLASVLCAALAMDARVTAFESRVANLSSLATSTAKGQGRDKVPASWWCFCRGSSRNTCPPSVTLGRMERKLPLMLLPHSGPYPSIQAPIVPGVGQAAGCTEFDGECLQALQAVSRDAVESYYHGNRPNGDATSLFNFSFSPAAGVLQPRALPKAGRRVPPLWRAPCTICSTPGPATVLVDEEGAKGGATGTKGPPKRAAESRGSVRAADEDEGFDKDDVRAWSKGKGGGKGLNGAGRGSKGPPKRPAESRASILAAAAEASRPKKR